MVLTGAFVSTKVLQRFEVRELTGSQVVVDMRSSSVPEKEIVWYRLRNQTVFTSYKTVACTVDARWLVGRT